MAVGIGDEPQRHGFTDDLKSGLFVRYPHCFGNGLTVTFQQEIQVKGELRAFLNNAAFNFPETARAFRLDRIQVKPGGAFMKYPLIKKILERPLPPGLKRFLNVRPGCGFKQSIPVKIPEGAPESFVSQLPAKHMEYHRPFVVADRFGNGIIPALELLERKILIRFDQGRIVSQNLQTIPAGIFFGFHFFIKVIRHIGR